MGAIRQIHWGRVLLAGFLAEVSVMAGFFLLLGIFTLVGMPEVAEPMSPLDFVDALVAMLLFLALIQVGNGSIEQPFLYWVAHGLKILGGITGGLVTERRRRVVPLAPAQIRT